MSKTYLNTTPEADQLAALDKYVSARLRERRRLLSLTQKELAKSMGLSYQQIQKYETGANRVSAGRLYFLAKALGVPVTYFFDGVEDHDPETGEQDEAAINMRVRNAINGLVDALVDHQKRRPRGFLD